MPTCDLPDVLLADALADMRFLAGGPPPAPNRELAEVLAAGFSTDKGTPLVTAVRNVYGPAEQVAGLPKWRKERTMFPLGFLSGVGAKVAAGVGVAVVGVSAAGAAGALPGPAQRAVASVVQAVTPFELPSGKASTTITAHTPVGDLSAKVAVGIGAGGATAKVKAGASIPVPSIPVPTVPKPTVPSIPLPSVPKPIVPAVPVPRVPVPTVPSVPGVQLPGLPSLPSLPGLNVLPECLRGILDPVTGNPLVALSGIPNQVMACVQTLVGQGVVPAAARQCVTQVMGVVRQVTSARPGQVPSLTGFDVGGCSPVDVSKCLSSVFGMVQGILGSVGGGGLPVPNLAGLDLRGCLPFNLDVCLNSVIHVVPGLPGSSSTSAGTSLNLASCVPFPALNGMFTGGMFAGLPGLGGLSGILSSLPVIGGGGGLGGLIPNLGGLIPSLGGLIPNLGALLPGLGGIPGLDIVRSLLGGVTG